MKIAYILRAVAFQSGSNWVAQCLEYDIATQAETLDDLPYELERILVAHILVGRKEGLLPFAEIPKAPRRFWEMYKRAGSKIMPVRRTALPIPEDAPPLAEKDRPRFELRSAA
jgi:hypothetical protein